MLAVCTGNRSRRHPQHRCAAAITMQLSGARARGVSPCSRGCARACIRTVRALTQGDFPCVARYLPIPVRPKHGVTCVVGEPIPCEPLPKGPELEEQVIKIHARYATCTPRLTAPPFHATVYNSAAAHVQAHCAHPVLPALPLARFRAVGGDRIQQRCGLDRRLSSAHEILFARALISPTHCFVHSCRRFVAHRYFAQIRAMFERHKAQAGCVTC